MTNKRKAAIIVYILLAIIILPLTVTQITGPKEISKSALIDDAMLSYKGKTYIYEGTANDEEKGKLLKGGFRYAYYSVKDNPDYIIKTQMREAFLFKRLGCDVEYSGDIIKYGGREYHVFDLFGEAYEYEKNKLIYEEEEFGVTDLIYTLKNDDSCDFLVVEAFRERTIYTCLDIDTDYIEQPENQVLLHTQLGDEEYDIDDEESINQFYTLSHYKGKRKKQYNPSECTIIRGRLVPNTPVSHPYYHDTLIFDGTEWLIFAEMVENEDSGECKYYGYTLHDTEIACVFIDFMYKYYRGLFIDTFDYSYYDPMAYIAD